MLLMYIVNRRNSNLCELCLSSSNSWIYLPCFQDDLQWK